MTNKTSFLKSAVAGVAALAILGAGSLAEARPHGPHGPPPPPMHHHHHPHGDPCIDPVFGACLGLGIIGGIAALSEPRPAVVQQPVVVQPVTQVQNVWVEGRYIDQVQPNGTVVRVWQPGHYEQRTIVVQ